MRYVKHSMKIKSSPLTRTPVSELVRLGDSSIYFRSQQAVRSHRRFLRAPCDPVTFAFSD